MKDYSEEILKRIEAKKLKQKVQRVRLLAGLTVLLMVALGTVLLKTAELKHVHTGGSVMGALLLEPESGIYVLIGVLAFLVGICFAVLVVKYKSLKNQNGKEKK